MKTQEKQRILFVGIDVHKQSHTAVALSPFGEVLGEETIGNQEEDFSSLVTTVETISQRNRSISTVWIGGLYELWYSPCRTFTYRRVSGGTHTTDIG